MSVIFQLQQITMVLPKDNRKYNEVKKPLFIVILFTCVDWYRRVVQHASEKDKKSAISSEVLERKVISILSSFWFRIKYQQFFISYSNHNNLNRKDHIIYLCL